MIERFSSILSLHLSIPSSDSEEYQVGEFAIPAATALFVGISTGLAISGCCLCACYALRGRMTHRNPTPEQQPLLDVEQGQKTHRLVFRADDLFQKFEKEDWFKKGKVPAEDGRVSFETDDLRILFKQFSVEYLSVFTEGREVLLWDPSFESILVELAYVCCYYELRNLGESPDSKLLDPKQSHLGEALSRLLFLTSAAERGKALKMEKGMIQPYRSERFDPSLVTALDTQLHIRIGMRDIILDFLETKFGKDKLKASPLKGYFNFDD